MTQLYTVKLSDGRELECLSLREALEVARQELAWGLHHDVFTPDGDTIWIEQDGTWESDRGQHGSLDALDRHDEATA